MTAAPRGAGRLDDVPLARWSAAIACSGAAALVDQVLWVRRLGEILGQTAYAVTIVLAVFFAGVGLGSLVLGRLADRTRAPLRLFCVLELVIAVFALAFVPLADALEAHYLGFADPEASPMRALLVKGAVAALVLLPPTFAMGGTLPVLVRHAVRSSGQLAAHVGRLYGVNTLGAAAGVALATFVLVPWVGVTLSFVAAAGLNGLAVLLAASTRRASPTATAATATATAAGAAAIADASSPPAPRATARAVSATPKAGTDPARLDTAVLLGAAAASGFVAVGFEVLWTRAFAARFPGTVYAYAVILLAYLLALGLGPLLVGRLERFGFVTRAASGWVLGAAGVAALVSVVTLGSVTEPHASTLLAFHGRQLLHVLVVLGPAVVLFGLGLPILARLVHRRVDRVGAELGRLLLVNTLASVAGSLTVGLWLLPRLGLKASMVVLAWLLVAYAAFVILPWARPGAWARSGGLVAAAVAATVLLPRDARVWRAAPDEQLVGYAEGVAASIAVVRTGDGELILKLDNTYRLGSTRTRFAQDRQGLIPVLLHDEPRRALMIGVGTGGTAGVLAAWDGLAVDALEIVPELGAVLPLFAAANHGLAARIAEDPDVRLLTADARHFVRATSRRYDVVVGDLFVPWRAGEGAMYTLEHLRAVRRVLAEDGLYCQWLPLYQLGVEELRTIVATFCEAFPAVDAYWLYFNVEQPAVGLVGAEATPRPRRLAERMADPAHAELLGAADLAAVEPLLASRIAGRDALVRWSAGAPLETRDRPRIEMQAPRTELRPRAERARAGLHAMLALTEPAADPDVARHQRALAAALTGLSLAPDDPAASLARLVEAHAHAPRWPWIALVLEAATRRALDAGLLAQAEDGARALATSPTHAHVGAFLQAVIALRRDDLDAAEAALVLALAARPGDEAAMSLLEQVRGRRDAR